MSRGVGGYPSCVGRVRNDEVVVKKTSRGGGLGWPNARGFDGW